MADIYIVNVATGGYYTEQSSYYHHTESEAHESFDECMDSVGEDPTLIELIRLNTETLEAVTIRGWEGTDEDVDDEDEDEDDDWIVEGRPEEGA